jgi:hypothetical protein
LQPPEPAQADLPARLYRFAAPVNLRLRLL